MILLYKDLIQQYKSDYKIKKLIEEGKIFKIEKGIYSDNNNINYLEILTKKYPNAIFTMESAFYYHNLTDVIPDKEYLALRRDSTKINDNRIKEIIVCNYKAKSKNKYNWGISIYNENDNEKYIELGSDICG